jgi:hypothetical protein
MGARIELELAAPGKGFCAATFGGRADSRLTHHGFLIA